MHQQEIAGFFLKFVTLAMIMLIMPASSAQAERLFSCMNFINSDHWNRLGEEHLNHTITLFTSEYELDNFPYHTALEIFLAQKGVWDLQAADAATLVLLVL
jgi:hypothetical protein